MNAVDCLQYYENFYDSFCSEFAIPRAHTSQSSSSRPSSCNNRQIQDFNRNNGKLSENHFYYYDTFSNLSPHQADEDETQPLTEYTPQVHPRFFYHEFSDNDPLNEFNEVYFGQPFSMSLDQIQPFKKKGPTPPPKQRKIKQILDYHPPPLPPSADGKSQSIPDFFQKMDSTGQFMLRPSAQDEEPECTTGTYFHQSFESIASCPVPPPPKHVRAPQARHMSVERLPSQENNPSLSEKNQRKNSSKRREPMSLSDFLKLTSNNVFKKPAFSSKLQSSPPLLPCGHINNTSDNATSSPPASVSSSGEGGIKQSRSQDGGRHSVLTFKKKCGVTKRRKKIDESLFKPTTSTDKSDDILVRAPSSSQENNNNSSRISILGNPNGTITMTPGTEAESSQYSITNNPAAAADDAPSPIMLLAEINNDTEFELDPLPEKDSDDVLDFSWTLSPVMGPDDMGDGNSRAIVKRKNSRRKPSNSSTTGAGEGNGRPSSRCSLIINSLMGHLSGLTKTTQEQPQESHPYQCSSKNNSCSNHNFAHHLDHRHNHQGRDDDHHHPSAQDENGNHHHNPSRKKFDHRSGHVGKASQEIGKNQQKNTFSDNCIPTTVTTNTSNITSRNNHRSPHRRMTVDLNPTNGNGYTDSGQLKRANNKIDSQRRRSDLLLTSSSPKECNPFHKAIQQKETGAHSHFIGNRVRNDMRMRPRSIAAFNLDIDAILPLDDNHKQHAQEQQCQSRKYSYFYPQCDAGSLIAANSGSKSLSNINFANGSDLPCENDDGETFHHHKSGHITRYPHGETRDESFPGFGNVFGCIPRVSLSQAKARQRDDTFLHYQQQQHLKPQFAVGGSNKNTVTNSHRQHHQQQPDQNYHTFHESGMTHQAEIHQHPQRRRNCSGLFCQDDDCYDDHDEDIDKYDKYYGQYSLTGLNIPMLAANAAAASSSQKQQHFKNNVITAAKSAEELVLNRYYAHCNKIVQNNPDYPPSPPPHPHILEKENKKLKRKNKQKTSNSIFKGNRAYSLTEKIWKNVSLPIISSANNGNNKIGSGTSLLCNHRKQRQIEECIHCTNELQERQPQQPQQLHNSNHHKSRRREQPGKSQRRKTVDSLFPLEENCYHQRDRHYSERDLLDHHPAEEQAGAGRLIALKKLSRSSNSIITGTTNGHRQKQNKNVNGFLYDLNKHTFSNTNDVIGDLSSSSLSSSYTTQAAVSVHHQPHQRVVKKAKKQHRKRCAGFSSASADCLNTLTSTDSSSEEEDVGDNGRRTATTIAAHSIKGVRVQDKRKSISCDDFISRVDDDYDEEIVQRKGQGQLTVKVKGGDVSKRKESKGMANNNNKAAGEQRRKHLSYSNSSSNHNHNSFGLEKLSSSIINECKNDNDDDGIQVKSFSRRQDSKVHLSKLKRRKSSGGGIVPKVVTVEMNPITVAEEGKCEDSSESSAISSLPTSSSSHHHHQNCDHDHQDQDDVGVKKEKRNKNRVKWTFLTSGLAKATRKLSSGSSRSSITSFTTCNSDSGASSHNSFKKESSENTSTSSSCASSGIEVGRKKGKNKNSTSIIKTAVVKNEVANDDIIFSGKVKSSTKKVEDTKRRNTAEVFFNETTGEASISTSNMFRRPQKILPPSQQRSKTTLITPATANRTASLRRRPSYNAKKQRPIAAPAVSSGIRKKPLSLGQADIISSTTLPMGPSVFLRKPLRFPHLTRVVSAPVGSSTAVNHTSIFSAFSNSSRNSSTSSSSTSGYTSNVTRQTSKFLKSFRKRWAKKNNKVADGDEEKAATQLTKRDDEDDNDCNGENDENYNGNNLCHYTPHPQHDKVETSPTKKAATSMNAFSGTINRLSLTRKKRRNTSRASKQAIFSTFYIGPAITDPMEEEKIYVTKDFADVTLDLQSGEVKKTCDGTLLFKADTLCFADKNKLKKKSKKLKLKMEKQIIMKKKQEDEEERVMISRDSKADEMRQQQKGVSSKERKDEKKNGKSRASGGSGEQMEFNKKNNYVISHAHVHQQQSVGNGKEDEQEVDETVVISRRNGGNANSGNKNSKSHESKYFSKTGITSKNSKSEGKVKISSGNSASALMTMTKNTIDEATTNSSGKSRRVSGSGLIKSYLGISKDLHTGVMRGANRKVGLLSCVRIAENKRDLISGEVAL